MTPRPVFATPSIIITTIITTTTASLLFIFGI
jgi:hypothetical protein